MRQVFVESLDRAFENVCELDLIFHFDQVSQFISVEAKLIRGPLRSRGNHTRGSSVGDEYQRDLSLW